MQKILNFKSGLKDGLPIALGYISVSFAFGILAIKGMMPLWAPILTSITNFTGTGQFVGMELIISNALVSEIAFTVFIINIRYLLMSISLSQKLKSDINFGQRLFIAFGNTDEIFAVAMAQNEKVNFKYMAGLILSSFSGWILGTTLGALFGNIIPQSLQSALGIMLYGMFIAIIIPPAKKSRPILIIILFAILLSCIFKYVPVLNQISSGFTIVICGVCSAILGALVFPLKNKIDEEIEK